MRARRASRRSALNPSAPGLRGCREAFRPRFEPLEDRTLLDSGSGSSLPAAIVVGRVLSAYYVGGVKNNQETITYTVYNEQVDPETGVLLTTSLEPGATFLSASPLPDMSGLNLAWSLGTINGYDRASVTLTVALGSNPVPTMLDSGAHAYAILDAGAVSNTTLAATLSAGNAPTDSNGNSLLTPPLDPNDPLAASVDANDPFIQEEAAKLDYDPQNIFNFLHTQVGYNSYVGSLRGARGTLWSMAGNAIDVANLGVALMRASGIPAQYVSGTLSQTQAQQLILSMFPASFQNVGIVPAGTQTSDPANDPQLLAETEAHDWFQFDAGSGLTSADPLMPGAAIGASFTTPTGTFTQIPDSLRQKTEITLNAEIQSQAGALFGFPLSTTAVLDATFNDAELVGRPLSLGNFVSNSAGGFIFTEITNTYSPYLLLSDEAYPDGSHDAVLRGATINGHDYQEVLTNFPLAGQILTGLFLNMTLTGPGLAPASFEHTLLDRIGYAARQGGAQPSLSFDPNGPPAISDMDITTINVMPGLQYRPVTVPVAAAVSAMLAKQTELSSQLSGVDLTNPAPAQQPLLNQAIAGLRDVLTLATRSSTIRFAALSDSDTMQLSAAYQVMAYADRPRIILASSQFGEDPTHTTAQITLGMDLVIDHVRVIPYPGQVSTASFDFNTARGIDDNVAEAAVLTVAPSSSGGLAIVTMVSTADIFAAAVQQGVGTIAIGPGNVSVVSSLAISDEAKARIAAAVLSGLVVIVPVQSVVIDGAARIGWYQVDPQTGETTAVSEQGTHDIVGNLVTYLVGEKLEKLAAAGVAAAYAELLSGLTLFAILFPAEFGGWQFHGEDYEQWQKEFKEYKEKILKASELVALGAELALAASGNFIAAGVFKEVYEQSMKLVKWAIEVRTGVADPPVFPLQFDDAFHPVGPRSQATGTSSSVTPIAAGPVSAADRAGSVTFSGQVSSTWQSTATSRFSALVLNVPAATIADAQGHTIGTGAAALSVTAPTVVSIAGNVAYSVSGAGDLSFYGPASPGLGVGGDWQSYNASLNGSFTMTLSTGALALNGAVLPPGTYRITSTSATLTGSGTTSSPTYASAASIHAANGTVYLGPGTGSLSLGGTAVDPARETTLTAYSGTANISVNGNGMDSVTLNGTAANALTISNNSASLTTDQNTPLTFHPNLETSFADTYSLTANAPPGWTVSIDARGNVTATPAPGLQGGTYPIQVIAQSTTNPDLVSQSVVNVTITPTQPGIVLTITPDPVFTVPFNGAQLPTAFRATVQNQGPAADTFNLSFSNVPSGFTILSSATSVTIPAGQTGIVGVDLQPSFGQSVPPVGTQVSFTVTATSTSNTAITQTRTETFTIPAIDAVTMTANQPSLSSTPGVAATTTLTLTNVGNVPETVTLTATLPSGVTAGAFTPVTLQPGQSTNVPLALTPDSTVPLNSAVDVTITATFGSSTTPVTTTTQLSLIVRSVQVVAVQQAANAVSGIPSSQIGANLSMLADALAQLQGNPTDGPSLARVQFLLGNLNTLIQADPALASFVSQLQSIASSANSGDVSGLLSQTAAFFNKLAGVLTQEADQQFTATLSPNQADLAPGQAQSFNLQLTSTSPDPIALTLGSMSLPSGVTVVPGQTQVTLMPGQTLTIPIMMTQSIASTKLFTLEVTASASVVSQVATAFVAIRPATADVLSVTAMPVAVSPGGSVAVSASIFNTANAARNLLARVDLLDASGAVVASSANMPFNLAPSATPISLDLGSVATTGLANGLYSARVSLLTVDGVALPGRTAQNDFEIGAPVSASISQSTVTVPPGSSSVSSTVTVTDQLTSGSSAPAKFGDIQVLYSAANSFGLSDTLDGTVFVVENTSGTDITNGVLTVLPPGGSLDSFNVGTIPAGGRAIIEPGITDDGGTNHTFFAHTGTLRDESEQGPNGDDTSFDFKATQGSYFLDSGNFTPAATKGPSVDNPSDIVNFLGGPNDQDLSLTHVFAPTVVANLYGTFQQPPGLTVEVGYADNLRANPFFPNPWNGSPNTIFAGGGSSFDSGAIRIINDGTSAVTINDVTVTLFGGQTFDLWGSNTIPAGANLILAQTNSYNFDSSDFGVLAFPQTYPDGETAHAARVSVTVNGQVITLLDTGHVLTTGGSDLAAGGANESQNWRPIGTTGISNPNGTSLAVTVTQDLPASGYNVDPASVNPTASTVSASQVVWTPPPLTEAVPTTFQLSGTVTNIAPGEVRQITTGSSVVATSFGPNGTPIQTTLPFAPLVVAADHIISLGPVAQTVDKNATASYTVTLTNQLATAETYTLTTEGLDGLVVSLAAAVPVAPGQSVQVPLTISVPVGATPGTVGFVVFAETLEGGVDSAEGQLTIASHAATSDLAVDALLTPSTATVGQGDVAPFVLDVINVGDASDTYNLTGTFPTGISGTFAPSSLAVAPGLSNFRDVALTLKPAAGTKPGSYPFTVEVTSAANPSVSAMATGTLIVAENGVTVTLNPPSGAPGTGFQATVTNTGSVADTFNLALAGPAALVAQLGSKQVSLPAGGSQVVPISTSSVNFAVPDFPLNLTATATSQANSSVKGAATADLEISSFNGLDAHFNPALQVLAKPGGIAFLLMVDNTGNVEDSYTATITGTNGPVTASLMGLDGAPTQAIPLFRLPGLSTGAILLQTNLMAYGAGTITVQVQSTTHSSLAATTSAEVKATQIATATSLQASPNPAVVGQAVTLTATVADDPSPLGGTITFSVDGAVQSPVALRALGGAERAILTLTTLSVGRHRITASYSGDASHAPSATATAAIVVVNPLATAIRLSAAPNPSLVGQGITLTAVVTAAVKGHVPGGRVVFTVDGTAEPAVMLQSAGSVAMASFVLSGATPGNHRVSAVYTGDAEDSPSVSQTVVLVVNGIAPLVTHRPTDGPVIGKVQRFGYHMRPTALQLSFSESLDPASAQNVANYVLTDFHGRDVGIASAVYDSSTDSVTLHPAARLKVREIYRLVVLGTGTSHVTDVSGRALDGSGTGSPGSDFSTFVTAADLVVGPPPRGPARLTRERATVGRIAAREAAHLAALASAHRSPDTRALHRSSLVVHPSRTAGLRHPGSPIATLDHRPTPSAVGAVGAALLAPATTGQDQPRSPFAEQKQTRS
jgi:uncharacterized membrane protein/transglutaminase-like putative cysteine protease